VNINTLVKVIALIRSGVLTEQQLRLLFGFGDSLDKKLVSGKVGDEPNTASARDIGHKFNASDFDITPARKRKSRGITRRETKHSLKGEEAGESADEPNKVVELVPSEFSEY
jgi:hypothetical protein